MDRAPPGGQSGNPSRAPASDDAMLLEVKDLSISFQQGSKRVEAVKRVNLVLEAGKTLGIVGESGCGKSLTIQALMGLLPETAQAKGRVTFQGVQLLGAPDHQLQSIRGRLMSMVFQEPMTALNPLQPIGRQVAEPLRIHFGMRAKEAKSVAIGLLDRVGIPDAMRRADAYPHQFSGGQRQRITLAIALACSPALLLADEPTTALDATVARQVLSLIRELVDERQMGMILVSHDLGVIAESVEQIVVMYGGLIVEQGSTRAVFSAMAHPYTRGLFASRPKWRFEYHGTHSVSKRRLESIPGAVPELDRMPPGCAFAPRCMHAAASCHWDEPPWVEISPGHSARCTLLKSGS